MSDQLNIALRILRNLPTAIRYRAYGPKLFALRYQERLGGVYGLSPTLAAVHFMRFGVDEVARGDVPMRFTVNGESYRYDEDAYLALNPDVAAMVATGVYRRGAAHFVMEGYDEICAGKRVLLMHPTVQYLAEAGADAIDDELQALWVTIDGYRYDYVEDWYLKDHPEADVAVRAGRFISPIYHFIGATLPNILEGKSRLYTTDHTPKVEKIFDGRAKSGRNLCLFAHFDPDGVIDPYVVRYLEGLKTMDCEIVFVSGSVNEAECAKVAHLCSEFIFRNRNGRDFGSWYLAIKHCRDRFSQYHHIIWANDSVYFPVHPVDDLVSRMDAMALDVWGIHESDQRLGLGRFETPEYHLQSFFLGFSERAVSAGILDDYVDRYEHYPAQSKPGQIRMFEYWTALRAIGLGLRTGALCKVEVMHDAVAKQDRSLIPVHNINPTIHLWRQSLSWYKSPTLKVELLRRDHFGVFSFEHFAGLVDPAFYDVNLAKMHAARVVTGPKPAMIANAEVKAARTIDRSPFTGADSLCIFAHYDPKGEIKPYVLRFLAALEEVGCEFVFVSEVSSETEWAKLPASCRRIIQKSGSSSVARDMGSYWLGLSSLKEEELKFSGYLLVNDSVFFPVADHKKMFAEMDGQDYDLWGVVENLHVQWHIMSYLWKFKPDCFLKEFLPSFLADYRNEYAKWEQIRLYEMRYPNLLKQRGYKVGAYVQLSKVVPALAAKFKRENPHTPVPRDYLPGKFNMHHVAWDLLITDFNCPALKVEFLRDSKEGAEAMYQLPEMLGKYTSYDYQMVADVFGDVRGETRVKVRRVTPKR